MSTTAPSSSGAHRHLATTSGARLAAISSEVAVAFLARLGERGPDPIELALGAHEDDGTLVGVAAFGAVRAAHGSLIVAVVPERRRLRIGSDLLQALMADAARTGMHWFKVSYPAGAPAADALTRGCGFTTARRVDGGAITAVLDTTATQSDSTGHTSA